MWLVYMKQMVGCDKAREEWWEYRLPGLHHCSVDGFCAEAWTVYEFLGCFGTDILANRFGT